MLRTHQSQIKDLQLILEQINKKNLTMVEIGSFMGESMEIFANSGSFQKIYCVDPWKNGYDDTDGSSNMAEMAEITFDNKKLNFDFVEKIKLPSMDACEKFEDESIDMVYIDANHQPEMVKKDIICWSQKVKKGGFICGHDWFYQNGLIQKTVIETIGVPDYICNHIIYGGEGDGSWMKIKN